MSTFKKLKKLLDKFREDDGPRVAGLTCCGMTTVGAAVGSAGGPVGAGVGAGVGVGIWCCFMTGIAADQYCKLDSEASVPLRQTMS